LLPFASIIEASFVGPLMFFSASGIKMLTELVLKRYNLLKREREKERERERER